MKINLLLNNKNLLNTHTNIDPFADGSDDRICGNVTDFLDSQGNEICCDGEVEELIAHEIIEYFSPGQVDYILNVWVKKLSLNGTLVISAVDFEEVARGIIFGNLNRAEQLNEMLHGKQEEAWQQKKTVFSLNILVGMLETRGLKILKKINENFRCIIVAQRV